MVCGAALSLVMSVGTAPAAAQDSLATSPSTAAPDSMAVNPAGATIAPADASGWSPPTAAADRPPEPGFTFAADSVAEPVVDFDAFFVAAMTQRPDSTRVARVRDLAFERDAARFTLIEGDLWLATPVMGRVCAVVFEGRGTFALTPPVPIEREQVRRAYGRTTIERGFDHLVLIVADSTVAELTRRVTFGSGRTSKTAIAVLDECLRYVSDGKTGDIEVGLAQPFLEGRADGHFFSLIDSVKAERLFFEINPRNREEVTLWREPKARHIGLWRVWRRDDVCMFARGGATPNPSAEDRRPLLAVKQWTIDCRIGGNMGFAAVASITCESREPAPQRWASFSLYDKLVVDSVAWVGGRTARVFRGRRSDVFWVRCEPPLMPGETRTLRVRYHGPLIDRIGDWMLMGAATEWYPKPEGRHRTPFEIVFHVPSQYHVVTVGDRVSSETRDGVTTSRWRSDRPIHNASFVVGLFDEERFSGAEPPEVTALMFRGRPDPIRVSFGDVQVESGSRMDRNVAADAARAVAFFSRMLGPPPVSRIAVAEVPDAKGEAFPGIIQITWTPFRGRNVAAEDAVFRAHEVAHQWWGYGVDFQTYHDQWLSEGFADFSALWYLQEALGDTKDYLAVLEAWREQIMDDMNYKPADTPPAGPIWLGFRSARVEVQDNYALIVYKKGAWVLHMLRTMLTDLDTGNDEKFASLMRDFYARYEGRMATTEDFRRLAQRYAGQDLGWFFDQWVYGADVPTYRFAYRTERTSDGHYRVRCRVRQTGVPEGFRMPVPIGIDFGGGRVARVRVDVQGPIAEFDLPLMDRAPKAILFNDLQSVLCHVESAKW